MTKQEMEKRARADLIGELANYVYCDDMVDGMNTEEMAYTVTYQDKIIKVMIDMLRNNKIKFEAP